MGKIHNNALPEIDRLGYLALNDTFLTTILKENIFRSN